MGKVAISVFDVVVYILEQYHQILAMKLHRLVYYSQAWYLVFYDNPLFFESIEAWANGPVIPELYLAHRGYFRLSSNNINKGNSANLRSTHKRMIDNVLKDYGEKPSQWLKNLSCYEYPWLSARTGLHPGERGNKIISLASMTEYYETIVIDGLDSFEKEY